MFSGEFHLYGNDRGLPTVGDLSLQRLQREVNKNIPQSLLGAPANSYRISNVRYKPSQKLVIGLISNAGGNPIGIRIFPHRKLDNRLAKARHEHPDHTFILRDSDAVAWVFPAERKLKLDVLANPESLRSILQAECNICVRDLELVHFVPEHSYTARVMSDGDNGSRTYYLKIYYDDLGARTADIMRQLALQTRGKSIAVPSSTTYLPDHRLLLQSSLSRDLLTPLRPRLAAQALAQFHGLTADAAAKQPDPIDDSISNTIALVEKVFPQQVCQLQRVSEQILELMATTVAGADGLLHGDAHLGNLFTLTNGETGFIDLDRVALGPVEQDLTSFFAFKLWIALRERQSISSLLESFPNFVADYNETTPHPVSPERALVMLAAKMVTERIARGISRGKITDATEVSTFTNIATRCLQLAGHRRG